MPPRVVLYGESGAACLLGFMAVVTVFWHGWIEALFGVDPDRGNGSVEWAVVGVLVVASLSLGYLARRRLREVGASS